jgi:hypothetical protein
LRKEYNSNEGAVEGRQNIWVAEQREELKALEIPRLRSCRV